MSLFQSAPHAPEQPGFRVIAGSEHLLTRLLVCVGRIPPREVAAVHYHRGDEIVRVVDGEVEFVIGDVRRRGGPGDLLVIPPGVSHGFTAGQAGAVIEVVAEQNMGSYYSVVSDEGRRLDVEVHRAGVPWDTPAPEGGQPTDPAAMEEIERRAVERQQHGYGMNR